MQNANRLAAVTFALLIAVPVMGRAQAVIKVNDEVNFKLGVLGQFQADWLKDPATDETTQNLFIRRIRLLFGGQVAKNVTFFVETDAPNLGKVLPGGTNISPAVNVQDAYAEFILHSALAIDAGLMFVPFSRNSLQSAASLLPIDYGAYTFTQTGPTESIVGRDTGFQAKGHLLADRLEYRLGAFQGARDPSSRRAFRYAGRVQYELLDSEGRGFFYTGTYLGTKRVAAIGAAFDAQADYHAFDADAFIDYPSGPGAITAQVAYNRFDGGSTFATLPRQNVAFFEIGYLVRSWKLTPVLQVTQRAIVETTAGDETRWSVGANYWWAGHNANVKAAFGQIDATGRDAQSQFTVQLQVFYF